MLRVRGERRVEVSRGSLGFPGYRCQLCAHRDGHVGPREVGPLQGKHIFGRWHGLVLTDAVQQGDLQRSQVPSSVLRQGCQGCKGCVPTPLRGSGTGARGGGSRNPTHRFIAVHPAQIMLTPHKLWYSLEFNSKHKAPTRPHISSSRQKLSSIKPRSVSHTISV